MATIEEAIVEWDQNRPVWLRVIFRRITENGEISDIGLRNIVDMVVAGNLASPPPLAVTDLPTRSGALDRVELRSISDLENVNALLNEEALTFGAAGLTVVYGDNGSGKSGYARLIKEVAEARHKERVLPNAFVPDAARARQKAIIRYMVGAEERELAWPDLRDVSTRSIFFHDEACGELYLRSNSELAYQPSAMQIFDLLIAATDALRGLLDERIKALVAEALPALYVGTPSSAFLDRLDRTTTSEQIETACRLPPDADQKLAALVLETARLDATDPGKERLRLQTGAQAATKLADHFDNVAARLGRSAEGALADLSAEAAQFRTAADLASKISFADEPLSGVGTDAWRTLWAAAEAYSQSYAYIKEPFPVTGGGARCVLCQQKLSDDGGQRLSRFHAFVHNKTEADAAAAELRYLQAIQQIRETEVSPVSVSQALHIFQSEDESFTQIMTESLEVVQRRKAYLLSLASDSEKPELVNLVAVDTTALRAASTNLTARAIAVDNSEFNRARKETVEQRNALSALIELAKHKEALKRQVLFLQERYRIQSLRNGISTGQITAKVTELMRTYAAAHVNDRFIRECQKLCVEKVYLGDLGGAKASSALNRSCLGLLTTIQPGTCSARAKRRPSGWAFHRGLFRRQQVRSSTRRPGFVPVARQTEDRRNAYSRDRWGAAGCRLYARSYISGVPDYGCREQACAHN